MGVLDENASSVVRVSRPARVSAALEAVYRACRCAGAEPEPTRQFSGRHRSIQIQDAAGLVVRGAEAHSIRSRQMKQDHGCKIATVVGRQRSKVVF
jgi:hypothetical protein